MLAEALAWLFTPASSSARKTGHLSESIAIVARERRCRVVWAPHLAASRAALLASARRASKRRTALVLGSGPLLDVPLAELSAMFERVWLVDMVHPWRARWEVRHLANVRLIEHDVTESLGAAIGRPERFLDEADIDWVASVNLLSQLANPDICCRGMCASETEIRGHELMVQHLAYLARFRAPVCLLTDVEQVAVDAAVGLQESTDFRPLLAGWQVCAEWRWDIAPPGELAGGLSRYHRVGALERRQEEDQGDVRQAEG